MIRALAISALLVVVASIGCGPLDSPAPGYSGPGAGGPPPGAGAPNPGSGAPNPGSSHAPSRSEPAPPPTSSNRDPMRQLEADIVAAMNRLRANPAAFASELETYRGYHDDRGIIRFPGHEVGVVTNEGVAAVDEAISVARRADAAPVMTVAAGLSRAAREHAVEIGAAGHINHANARGEQPHQRMERYGVISGYSGENIGTGDAGGTNLVISLFVDDGIPNRGHRTNLLAKAFRKVGVGCAPHIHWSIVCVIDTAEGYRER